MGKTLDELSNEYSRRSVLSAEFPRLLHLAHAEGLLVGAMASAGLSHLCEGWPSNEQHPSMSPRPEIPIVSSQ